MAEYWKSTPKYFCKHCEVYVADTKIQRANHERTAKHQVALKRFLRNIHREHEQGEREKERAKREVERLNGVVGSSSKPGAPSSSSSSASAAASNRPAKPGFGAGLPPPPGLPSVEEQRREQLEQLAAMSVAIPQEMRGELAMAGEWEVTASRVIEDDDGDEEREEKVEAKAVGVRKRERTEDEKEREEALRDLYKKPRRWGRDTKNMPADDDGDLDVLLSGGSSLLVKKQPKDDEEELQPKREGGEDDADALHSTNPPEPAIKSEEPDGNIPVTDSAATTVPDTAPKTEEQPTESPGGTGVVFKQRKNKAMRRK